MSEVDVSTEENPKLP